MRIILSLALASDVQPRFAFAFCSPCGRCTRGAWAEGSMVLLDARHQLEQRCDRVKGRVDVEAGARRLSPHHIQRIACPACSMLLLADAMACRCGRASGPIR